MSAGAARVASFLISLLDLRLLVPRSCVLDILGHQTPQPLAGVPPWYLGSVEWRKSVLPLIAFEGLAGHALPKQSQRSRVVVMRKLGTRLAGAGYALLAQGVPQLLDVSGDMLQADGSYARNERQPILCRVQLLKETPLIPDLEQLENRVADEMRAPPATTRRAL